MNQYFKKEILLTIIFLIILFSLGNQSLICDKSKDTCYQSGLGSNKENSVKISEIRDVIVVESKERRRNSLNYIALYSPTLVTANKQIPFFKSPSPNLKDSEYKKAQFLNFVNSSQTKLTLKTTSYFERFFATNRF